MSYVTLMFDALRQRASLLLLGIVAFLLVLSQVPRWDSGWVQAIGSIAAIAAGFGYAALQNDLQRRQRVVDQRQAREHAISVLATALPVMRARVERLRDAVEREITFNYLEGQDALDLLGSEFLLLRPVECGSVEFAILSRYAGFELKSFAIQCQYAFTKEPLEEADIASLQQIVQNATEHSAGLKTAHDNIA